MRERREEGRKGKGKGKIGEEKGYLRLVSLDPLMEKGKEKEKEGSTGWGDQALLYSTLITESVTNQTNQQIGAGHQNTFSIYTVSQ